MLGKRNESVKAWYCTGGLGPCREGRGREGKGRKGKQPPNGASFSELICSIFNCAAVGKLGARELQNP